MDNDRTAVIFVGTLVLLVIGGAFILPSLIIPPSLPGSLASHPLFRDAAQNDVEDADDMKNTDGNLSQGGNMVRGNTPANLSEGSSAKNSYVLIEEFSDFQCPFCGEEAGTVKRVREGFGSRVKVAYKHFPITKLHPDAVLAAEASECARDQKKFWAYHDLLFDNQQKLEKEALLNYAAKINLNMTSFEECLTAHQKKSVVERNLAEGIQRGVRGTPTFFIDGELIMGAVPFNEFKSIIEQKLDQKLLDTQGEQQENSSS
ncbi:DsbA family protein [Candidatus Woesearchaeota archaeon]|nr:DsbA family protein [Candidatus Woesearchaeota archaeon]